MKSPVRNIKLRILVLEEGLREGKEPHQEMEDGAGVGVVGTVVERRSAELLLIRVAIVVVVGKELVSVLEVFLSARVLN